MKRIFLLSTFLLCLFAGNVCAQSSMSDSQIMDFIIKENERGTSRQQIMIKLMEKGVTVDRVRKLRSRYEKQKNGDVPGAIDISGYDKRQSDRLRQNNGENRQSQAEERSTMKRQQQERDLSGMSDRQRQLWQERQRELMADELDFVLPDTLDMYDNIIGRADEGKKKVFGRNIFCRARRTPLTTGLKRR